MNWKLFFVKSFWVGGFPPASFRAETRSRTDVDNDDSDVDVKMGLEIASAGHEEVDHCTGDQLADTEKVSLYFSSLLKMKSKHDDPHNCYCQYQHRCHHKHCTNDTN